MDDVDPLTTAKLREWQLRRLAIKDEMQASPERTLELSKVLDQMDDEHELILQEARSSAVEAVSAAGEGESSVELPLDDMAQGRQPADIFPRPFKLRLDVAADNVADLRKLFDMAVHELDARLESQGGPANRRTDLAGHMSGTLGQYRLKVDIGDRLDE